ncbi:MAG: NUDIX domain-containing protein [Prolixibacteraceae bacterium]|nr:NUDIX domain-containing protein [Prolixibacteraceae bacterium]
MIKKLIPGLIPLLVFILADEFWGMKVGLTVAVSIGLVELLITFIREKKLDRFVLLDTLLLVLLSALSYLFENEIFFKVKPAMIDLVLAAVIALSLFTKIDPLGSMTQRFMKGVELNGIQKDLMIKNIRVMFWMVLVHTGLVLWTAFFSSKEVWAFVSSFLLFIMMGVYLGFEVIRHKLKKKNSQVYSDAEEWLPMVDEEGRILGKALRSYCHNGSKTLHPVVHLHVLDGNRSLFLQKRATTKLVQPGKWDTAVGGHPAFGETIEESLKREASEEIGLVDFEAVPALKYHWDTEIESELVYCFVTYRGKPGALSSEEIAEGKFWKVREIEQNLGKGIFTPNFEHEFLLLKRSGLLKAL